LDIDFVLKAIETLVKCGTKKYTIIGGEPTLHRDYSYIVNALINKENEIFCTLVTNGRLLSNGIPREWLGNNKIQVVISLHGANRDHYFLNTGSKAGFQETRKAIKKMVSGKVDHSVNVVISRENLPYIKDFVRIVSELKVGQLCFTIAIPSMNNLSYPSDYLELSGSVASIHSYCEEKKQKHVFIFSLPWCVLDGHLLSSLIKNGNLVFNCPAGEGQGIVIKEDGSLTICTHLSGYEIASKEDAEMILANPESFSNFWNSMAMTKLRKTIDVYRSDKCRKCVYRLHCKGGCPLWWKVYDFSSII